MRKNAFWFSLVWLSIVFIFLMGPIFLSEPLWAAEPQIAAGVFHTVTLKSDGTLWAWGRNDYGQLGDGSRTDRNTPVQVSGGENTWVAVAAGAYHTVALKSDGTLWTWGYNANGQLGDGTNTDSKMPVQVSGGENTWVAVAAGNYHNVALKSDGTLWTWGYNGYGQLGDVTKTDRNSPVQVFGGGNNWAFIAAGYYYTVALKSDGTLWTWGDNGNGQLGDGTNTDRNKPVQVSKGVNNWMAIAAGGTQTLAIKSDGTLWAWGRNFWGQLGDGTNTDRNAPVQVFGGGNTWVSLATGNQHAIAFASDGTLWAWGRNDSGQLGDGTNTSRNTPGQVSGGGNSWVAIAAGDNHTVALKSDGIIWAWGWNAYGQLGEGTNTNRNTPVLVSGAGIAWVAIAARADHNVALKSDGTLWAWGWNQVGQLGDGTNTDRHTPVQVSGGGNNWVAIAAGGYHTVALKSDGTAWAWGENVFSQVGDGTNTDRNTPVQVSGGNTWRAIAAGLYHNVAMKSDGTLWAWGWNSYGQIGDGTNTARNTPVQVSGGGNNWVAIAAGYFHTLALKSDGTLWTWGDNGYGQLGDGTNTARNTPVQVSGGGNNWAAIAAGGYHTVALKSDGTLWTWGYNISGQLGNNSTTNINTPIQVSGGGNNWTAIAAGGRHTAAMKSDGTLWAWGWNSYGQLGDGTNIDWYTPAQVPGVGNSWVRIAAGFAHTLALKSDGTLWAWGYNFYGQLGDGTSIERHSPVQIKPRMINIDFDGNGKNDLFWRHALTGQAAIWLMDGASYSSNSSGTISDLNWQIKGMGDFDGNGKTDILWQDASTGWTMIWFMDGTTLSSQQAIAQVGLTWQIKKIGDFDGDGKADVLWQDSTAGWTAIWFMDGATVKSTGAPAQVGDSNWLIKEVADFNGDGKADILWQNTSTGWTYIWFMNGATISSGGAPAQVGDTNWQIKEVGDFNGDGKADILWQNTSSGWTYIWFMNGATIISGAAPAQVGDASWQIRCVGDFNGDGKANIFWQHTTGWTYIWFMDGGTIASNGVSGVVSDMNWQIMN